jgi:PIN domain nuclease of toxin-antitoxin system
VFLLDTHIWIWLGEGDDRRIGPRTRQRLSRAESDGLIRVSPISLFEITVLHATDKLRLNRPLEQWIRDAFELSSYRLAELTAAVAIDAGFIPRAALADPADRMLVATARQLDATLVTSDRAILRYADDGHVRVHDGST